MDFKNNILKSVKTMVIITVCTIAAAAAACNVMAATWTDYATMYFMGNGGTFPSGSTKVSTTVSASQSTGGNASHAYTIPSTSQYTPSRTGYTFLGWDYFSYDPTSGGTVYLTSATYTYSPGSTVYWTGSASAGTYSYYLVAKWKIKSYNITYNYNDSSSTVKTVTKNYGSSITLLTPTRDGYDFLGWDTDSSADTVVYEGGVSYSQNAALTLYGVWSPHTYTISYNDNGGSGGPSEQTKTHDTDLVISSVAPTRTNFTFVGWSEDSSSITAEYLSGDTLTEERNMELYAVWRPLIPSNSVSITGDSEGTGGDQIYEDIYFSAKESLTYFSILIEYPSFLTYTDFELLEFEGNIYAYERTEGTDKVLEISWYDSSGVTLNGTTHLARVYFDVNDSSDYSFGTYTISADKSSSYYMNTSSSIISLTYSGSQSFEYITHIAEGIEISGEESISASTQYSVVFTPQNTTNQSVVWSVDDETIAGVDENGILTPYKNGTVTLTATTLDGSNLTASIEIEITGQKAKLSSLAIADAVWEEAFSSDCYEYNVYVPSNSTTVKFTAVFDSGSLICVGYGYLPSGIAKTVSISNDMQAYEFTISEDDYDNATYTIYVFREDVYGDVNSDGVIDNLDAAEILKHISGIKSLSDSQLEKADVNSDESVDFKDVIAILKK